MVKICRGETAVPLINVTQTAPEMSDNTVLPAFKFLFYWQDKIYQQVGKFYDYLIQPSGFYVY